MTKDEIRSRCRKVYIEVCNGRIFQYRGDKRGSPDEYEFVQMYRQRGYAEQVLESKRCELPYHWITTDERNQKREVVEFYLVPSKKIDP